MAFEPGKTGREGRRSSKKNSQSRARSVHYPENLREGDDKNDDVAVVKGNPGQSVNQSVFSMITRAGSTTDFHKRFDDESSDSGEETPTKTRADSLRSTPSVTWRHAKPETQEEGLEKGQRLPRRSTELSVPDSHSDPADAPEMPLESPDLDDPMSRSTLLPPKSPDSPSETRREKLFQSAPVMSQILEAQADLAESNSFPDAAIAETPVSLTDQSKTHRKSLAEQLKDMFGFDEPEEVIAEYPCWLTQSVLLQGYMYLTQRHICFYAYAPKKSNTVVKSGHLSKRGKQNPKYSRYWFQLKGDELSYRTDPADPYFRSGNIDLRFGISASLSEPKEKTKGAKDFTVVTPYREYHFRADSAVSAKEWVKQLQRVIFRSHNQGDSVKISMPIENIMDVEESPVMDVAETVKIRVADADENFAVFAVEEYFFTFFGNGDDALKVLQTLIEDTAAQKIPENLLVASPVGSGSRSREPSRSARVKKSPDIRTKAPPDLAAHVLREPVRATIDPYSPIPSDQISPRPSGEWARNSFCIDRKSLDSKRKSLDVGRKHTDSNEADFRQGQSERGRSSASRGRQKLQEGPSGQEHASALPQASTESFVHSLDQACDSSATNISSSQSQVSGSQMLDRSDLFQSPTIDRLQMSQARGASEGRQTSQDHVRRAGHQAPLKIAPPQRSHSEHAGYDVQPRNGQDAGQLTPLGSSPSLQHWVKAGNYPLQRAAGFADYLKTRSKKFSNRLATESRGYVEKVSGIWAGGRKHYSDQEAVISDDPLETSEAEDNSDGAGDRFRAYFALPSSEKLLATYFGWLHRGVPIHGKIYISKGRFCFRGLFPGSKTKMVLPIRDIENVHKERGFRFSYSGLVVVVRGHEEVFFDFKSDDIRSDCVVTLLKLVEVSRDTMASGILSQEEREQAEYAKAEHKLLLAARNGGKEDEAEVVEPQDKAAPILFDDPRASIINFKPTESLRVTCLTIGSRGDVQPYIALCKGLLQEGHKPTIATHVEFKDWILKHGIQFRPVEGDPAELMRICVENGMFTFSFLKEASAKFRGWIDELLSSAWKACQDADILIESPSAMAGSHIAEALGIPYYRAFTMPWTRTRAYPHAFVVPAHKKGGTYNEMSYYVFDQVFWKAIAGQVNRWRKKELGLRSTDLTKMAPHRVPFLYNFSPKVVPPPLDYSDWVHVTGYWFLDEASDWQPAKALLDFISQARSDAKKIVYIGFGSIVVSDPAALTKTVIESVHKADVRCILSKGWSDRLGNHDAALPEVPLPSYIHQIKSAPHDWLFKQIDAAAHHGGAGTTGASLRAGLPTIVKPFFGDQYFFGSRIEDLGVGICLKKLNVSLFSRALWEATHSERMISKAKLLGEQIRSENGVGTAIQTIYRDLEYAKSLVESRAHLTKEDNINDEEWTLIGDEDDPELIKRMHEFDFNHLQSGPRKSFQFTGRESLDLGA